MERCPYCFKPLTESGVCDCRYEESINARIEEALHPGAIVGACYLIGAVLGKGGFGITYKAFDLNMQKIVAIKEFYPDGMVTRGKLYGNITGSKINKSEVLTMSERSRKVYEKSLELFYREAVALGKLDKLPNVVHAHHVFRENGTAYIVMEYVNGKSLKAMVEERGKIPERELLPLLDPVLTVLGKVHAEKILHRDIAPDNIMIENGNPVLLDFGAARVDDGHHSSLVIGKKGYSSPEQIAGGTVDQRSDIYSMGATYYKALSGITPQDSGLRTLEDHVTPLKHLGLGISESVSDAVMKAMSVKPEDRFSDAAAFQQALKIKSPTKGKSGSEGSGTTGGVPSKRLKTAIIAASFLAVLAGGFFLFRDKIIPGSKPAADPVALTQEVIDAELTKIAEAQTEAAAGLTATAQKKAQDAIGTEWAKMTEAVQTAQTEAAKPTSTQEPTKTLRPSSTPKPTSTLRPTATKTRVPTNTPKPTSTPRPTATKTRVPTNTPKPTSTPRPTATKTRVPTNTPRPTATPGAEELFQTGSMYYSKRVYKIALKYFEASAAQGHAKAQYFLGYMYQKGLGVQQSDEKAMEWYQKAADQGHSSAIVKLDELKETNFPESADKMSIDKLFELANSYYSKADYKNAFLNFEKAAEQGHKESQYFTGFLYEKGWGVEQSYEKAAEWYQKAANQGHSQSKWKLDDMKKLLNKEPTVTPTPTVQRMVDRFTVSWRIDIYNKNTDEIKGESISDPDISDLAENEEYVIVFTVENNTSDHLKPGISAGLDDVYLTWPEVMISSYSGWNFYITDSGEPGTHDWRFYIDGEKAAWGRYTIIETKETELDEIDYFKTANSCYMKGDYTNARINYEKAALLGHKESQYFLGYLYEKGLGVEKSYENAVEWYQKAADQGHKDAKMKLEKLKKLSE